MELEKYGTVTDIEELLAIRDRIDDLLDSGSDRDALTPKADLFDSGDAYQLLFEVPGVTQENLEIALQGRDLTVAGIREPENGAPAVFRERPSGHFQRTVTLPEEVDRDGITAQLREGLLVINLPKA